jgi:hypothetical protein
LKKRPLRTATHGFLEHKAKSVNKGKTKMPSPLATKYSLIINTQGSTASHFQPRPDVAAIPLKFPMIWTHKDRNVCFSLQSWRFLSYFWNKLLATDDVHYFVRVTRFMDDWFSNATRQRNTMLWYDMAVGIRALHIALALEYSTQTPIRLSHARQELLHQLTLSHLKHLAKPDNLTSGNHAIYQMAGLAGLAAVANDPSSVTYAEKQLLILAGAAFDSNGLTTENSPFYHDYNIALLRQLLSVVPDGIRGTLTGILSRASGLSPWLTDPEGTYWPIGDTEGSGITMKRQHVQSHQVYGDYVALDLKDSGLQVIRSHPDTPRAQASCLVFHGTHKALNHSHCDQLSFLFYSNGFHIFTDSGKFTYEYNDWRRYFLSDRAHNTVGLAGVGIEPSAADLHAIEFTPLTAEESKASRRFIMSGKLQRPSYALQWSRRLEWTPNSSIVIHDTTRNSTPHALEQRFHLGPLVSAELCDGSVWIKCADVATHHLSIEPPPQTLDLVSGIKNDLPQGWLSNKYNTKQPALTIVASHPPETQQITTTLNTI